LFGFCFASTNAQLAKAYGNICTLWLGHKPIVVLYGFKAVKDGLPTKSEDVSGRLQTYLFNRFSSGKGEMRISAEGLCLLTSS